MKNSKNIAILLFSSIFILLFGYLIWFGNEMSPGGNFSSNYKQIEIKNNNIEVEDLQLNEVNLLENILGQHLTLEEYNIKIIEHFLQRNNQNVLKTAQDLGIGKTTIYRYINEGKIHLK